MADLTIGQVAATMRLRASAVRYYEHEGVLPIPQRRSGKRVYERTILDRLALIELAKECGFSLAEIRTLLDGFTRNTQPAKRWRSLAQAKLQELTREVARISRMKHVLKAICRCECRSMEECGVRARRCSTAG